MAALEHVFTYVNFTSAFPSEKIGTRATDGPDVALLTKATITPDQAKQAALLVAPVRPMHLILATETAPLRRHSAVDERINRVAEAAPQVA